MYYHYTNIEALYNIIRSGIVWFTSLAFMNDEMEGLDLHQVLTDVLPLKYGSEKCEKTLELIDTTIQTYLRFQMSFSASTLKDDISQWRAYTTLAQGICIEFEDGFISEGEAKKVKCIYDSNSKKQAIINNEYLRANNISIQRLLETPRGTESYVKSILKALVCFKNSSFRPEEEVRWVINLSGINDPMAKIKYRPHRLGLANYQEVKVNLAKVKSITIGPQMPNQNLKTIEDFMITNECAGFVTTSKVTLR